jgi:hypothetical protein
MFRSMRHFKEFPSQWSTFSLAPLKADDTIDLMRSVPQMMTSYSSGDGSAIVEGELREVESPSGLQEQKQQIEWLVDRMLILML